MDIFDRAQELEELHRNASLAALATTETGQTYSHCEDCGEPIPEARRKVVPGCHRCITCQEWHEKTKGRG